MESKISLLRSLKQSENKWSEGKAELESKATVNTSIKKTNKRVLSINSNKIAHAASSNFKKLKKIQKDDDDFNENDEISLNSIEMSIHKRQLGSPEKSKEFSKDQSNYSFNFDEKRKFMQNQETKGLNRDITEESIVGAEARHKSNSRFKKPYNPKEDPQFKLDSDSDVESEENKDDVINLHTELKRISPPYNYRQKSEIIKDDNTSINNTDKQMLAPPKTAMSRTKSLMNVDSSRPATAIIEHHSEMLDERSNIGDLRSYMGRSQSKNYEILRASSRKSLSAYSNTVLSDAGRKVVHDKDDSL